MSAAQFGGTERGAVHDAERYLMAYCGQGQGLGLSTSRYRLRQAEPGIFPRRSHREGRCVCHDFVI